MTPKNRSSRLLLNTITVLFVLLILLTLYNIINNRRMSCGCGLTCTGTNTSCPCVRKRLLIRSNEYYQPQIGTDFTTYLDQVRENQLKFSRN